MTDIKFDCPHCKQHIEAPEEMLGVTVSCPTCKGTLTVIAPGLIPSDSPMQTQTRACPFCGEQILAIARKCKHCGEFLDGTPPTPPPAAATPKTPERMASIREQTSAGGGGCALQGVAIVCLVLAVVTFMTIIGPIVFGGLALWLFFYGGSKARWHECSACSGKLEHTGVAVCPHCAAKFTG